MQRAKFVYVTFIASTPRKVWKALFDPALTAKYWQHENVSDWKQGSSWEHRRSGRGKTIDLVGKVVKYSPPRRLVLTWAAPEDKARKSKYSRVAIDIVPFRGVVRLTVTHAELEPGSEMHEGIAEGWPKVLSSLKSLLETGKPLPKLW